LNLFDTYRFIAGHPLTRNHKSSAVARWLRWQIASRVSRHSLAIPFVNGTRLLARSGMSGATGNIYCGLHEFDDMAFVLHFLRPGDCFVDVGANIGAYSILAAVTGAKVLSFEPVERTFEALLDNIHLNRMQLQIDARRQAIGNAAGTLQMTVDSDTTNRALVAAERYEGSVGEVQQMTLDHVLQTSPTPTLIKVDVEGYEAQVLAAGERVLSTPRLEALILELNGSGLRYGVSDEDLHRKVLSFGFMAYRYAPRNRTLQIAQGHSVQGNTLYLRNAAQAQQRVSDAPAFDVLGQML
jgi:FkbM family methyltransferase